MVQLSPQALILYKQMLDDTVFIKRQQWMVTNYAALIYAAIIWFAHNLTITPKIACLLSTFDLLTAAIAIGILIWFQFDLRRLRKRISAVSNYCFVGKEKAGFGITDKDKHPFARGGHILGALIVVCVAGAALALFALN